MTTIRDTGPEAEAVELLAALSERYRIAGRTQGDLLRRWCITHSLLIQQLKLRMVEWPEWRSSSPLTC